MSRKFLDLTCIANLNNLGKTATRKVAAVVTAAAILVGSVETGLAQGPQPPFNVGIATSAVKNVATKVGDGECGTFVLRAMEDAGAKPVDQNNRVWGEVISANDLRQGDIIQLAGDGEKAFHVLPNELWDWIEGRTNHSAFQSSPISLLLSVVRGF